MPAVKSNCEPFIVKKTSRNKKVLITAREDLLDKIDEVAEKKGISRSALIEQALEYAMKYIV